MKFLGICGSLRKNSFNKWLLQAAFAVVPTGIETSIAEINDIPLYNADLDEAGQPEPVQRLKSQIRGADALVIATPEYNYSIPGVLKNAIDWASRPPKDNVFAAKPLAIMSASTGMLGGARAQYHLRQMTVFLDMHPMNKPEVIVAKAMEKFSAEGELLDELAKELLKKQMATLEAWARKING